MGALRVWKTGLCSTYTLLLVVLLLGFYTILFSPAFTTSSRRTRDIDVDTAVATEIENTKNRIIYDVKYEPIFKKYYPKYYGNASKQDSLYSVARRSLTGIADTLPNKIKNNFQEDLSHTERELEFNQLWHKADSYISHDVLIPENDADVNEIVNAMATARIVAVDVLDIGEYETGTSEKWIASLEGGQKAVMKLMWEEKGQPKTEGLCNYGYEMPWAEIVGFHLHRVLDFRNTPYVAGRVVDIRKEILPVASPRVTKRVELGVGSELCIVGKCHFCQKENRLCSKEGKVEASLAYWVPRHLDLYTWYPNYMPWSTPRMEEWKQYGFNNRTFCEKIRQEDPYTINHFYYDLFDFAIIDTIMYHFDTKHYVINDESPARGLTVRLDHGRAFCRYDSDEENVFMAPIIQCCTLRRSTYEKLVQFKRTELFIKQLKILSSSDSLAPFLDQNWSTAFERRLRFIFQTIDKCAKANGGIDKILV